MGESKALAVPDGSVLSGTLADGSPFAFSSSDFTGNSYSATSDHLAEASIILRRAEMPLVVGQITASTDVVPLGLRRGQTLTVDAGGVVSDHFGAGFESQVIIQEGGVIGRDFEAAGANIQVLGGTIEYDFDVSNGTVVDVRGGRILDRMEIFGGGVVNLMSGVIEDNAQIGPGGELNVYGGRVGEKLVAADGVVNVAGGSIANEFAVYPDGIVNIYAGQIEGSFDVQGVASVSGGELEKGLLAKSGSVVNVSGGDFHGHFRANADSAVNITGGEFHDFVEILEKSDTRISGGNIDARTTIERGGQLEFAGGVLADRLAVMASAQMTVIGAEFSLNGESVSGIDELGDTIQLDLPTEFTLTGVLADGTPFAFTSQDYDSFRPGTLHLKLADVPPAVPKNIRASTDSVPLGLRGDQILTVDAGGIVQNNFMVGRGSTVNIEDGGVVGANLEAIGGNVNVRGGALVQKIQAIEGTVVNVMGGVVAGGMELNDHSVANVYGGDIGLATPLLSSRRFSARAEALSTYSAAKLIR